MSQQSIEKNVKRLRRLDACAVSDALDKLALSGAVGGMLQLATERRIAGRVTTVKLVKAQEVQATVTDQATQPRHLCAAAIEASGSDSVIVVEQRTGIEAGSWGGLLTLGAKLRQVAGVISEGLVRDIDEAKQYDFPVYARGLTTRTARGRVAELGSHIDITVGEVIVSDGDYVIADNSGVVFITAGHIDAVLGVAENIVTKEAAMAKSLLSGQAITEVMGASYEHMLRG
jgi:4-hydroxy-4-methyl-2-oxoglutarate aldolase